MRSTNVKCRPPQRPKTVREIRRETEDKIRSSHQKQDGLGKAVLLHNFLDRLIITPSDLRVQPFDFKVTPVAYA